jgi:hypothetical protein
MPELKTKIMIITIENTDNLSKADWKKFQGTLKFKMMIEKVRSENPGCQIAIAPYKAWSEAKINRVEKEHAQYEASEKRYASDPVYRQKCEDWVAGAPMRQRPSSMRF